MHQITLIIKIFRMQRGLCVVAPIRTKQRRGSSAARAEAMNGFDAGVAEVLVDCQSMACENKR